MSKINVLVVPPDRAGVGFFRSIQPHSKIVELTDELNIVICYEPKWEESFLKDFQIVFLHRQVPNPPEGVSSVKIIQMMKKMGIKVVVDLDDHYILPKEHPMHGITKVHKFHESVIPNLKEADYITTTTPYFASKLKTHNNNVVVFPNAIDPQEDQFIPKPTTSERVRVGYIAGSSHFEDLKLCTPMFKSLTLREEEKIQMVLCGYDIRGVITNPQTNESRKIEPHESVWFMYEQMVTKNYEIIKDHPEYINYLKTFNKEYYPGEENMAFRRHWTKPITSYATHYNNIDISIAPLFDNEFNKCKSQLKVIEAGFFKKPLIAERAEPYKIDIKHGKNGFLVDSNKEPKEWYRNLKKLLDSEQMRIDVGESLYETVKDTYNLETVSRNRIEFYKQIVS